eukprot:Em0021g347a
MKAMNAPSSLTAADDIHPPNKSQQPTTAACSRTVKTRCAEMQSIISGGKSSVLMENEKAGISNNAISSAEVLAIKAGMAIPWNRMRLLRWWLKVSGVTLAGEERMRHICRQIVGDNLKGEVALFSFPLPSGGEELRGAPLVYIPELVKKVVDLLEENQRTRRLTWHNGVIPASEVWIKIEGGKGGGSFKMNFQIVNVAAPNSVHNTCVFCCYEASDTVTNLHIALHHYKDQITHLQGMKWRLLEDDLDLELALHSSEDAHSSFSTYSQELQKLHLLQAEMEQAQQSYDELQQMETEVAKCTATVQKGFSVKEDPFVKELDSALQSIGVHRQQYSGGAFIGNHVHKALKLTFRHYASPSLKLIA